MSNRNHAVEAANCHKVEGSSQNLRRIISSFHILQQYLSKELSRKTQVNQNSTTASTTGAKWCYKVPMSFMTMMMRDDLSVPSAALRPRTLIGWRLRRQSCWNELVMVQLWASDIKMQTAANIVQGEREDGSAMKALAWFGNGDVRMIEAPVPYITQSNDVIVKVTGMAACGLDSHLFHREIGPLQKGDILGHKFMGVVDRVGDGVANTKPSQRAVASFRIACGQCEYCKKMLVTMCDRTNDSPFANGEPVWAPYCGRLWPPPPYKRNMLRQVPYGTNNLVAIPDDYQTRRNNNLSKIFRSGRAAHAVIVEETSKALIAGCTPSGVVNDHTIKTLRNRSVRWLVEGYNAINDPNSRDSFTLLFESLTSRQTRQALAGLRSSDPALFKQLLPGEAEAPSDVDEDNLEPKLGCPELDCDLTVPELIGHVLNATHLGRLPDLLANENDDLDGFRGEGQDYIATCNFGAGKIAAYSYHCLVDTGVEEGDIVAVWLGSLLAYPAIVFIDDMSQGLGTHWPMGWCGIIGDCVGVTNDFMIGTLMEKGIWFIGNGQCPVHKYWEEILNDYVILGKFDPTFIITHGVPIEDMAKLYVAFDKRINGVEKVFVETKFSSPPSAGCPTTSRVGNWGKETD
ncbi:GroES-like protein [Ceratobasidium sp. AG-I]|nr:GroES-like protein [Ceratobasidium sp. AG-I]